MKPSHLFVLCCSFAFIIDAQAEIYKRVDEDGHVTYSSTPLKGAQKLQLEPLPTMPPPPKARTPQNFPRVNAETQNRRDDTRRKILEDELATEQGALTEARRQLEEAEANPEVYRGPDGKTYRNVAKYEEKVDAAKEAMRAHEKNVEALQTELANLK